MSYNFYRARNSSKSSSDEEDEIKGTAVQQQEKKEKEIVDRPLPSRRSHMMERSKIYTLTITT